MKTIQEWFYIGMKRDIPMLLLPGPVIIDLGGSDARYRKPLWDAEIQSIPNVADLSVDTIYASHFLEHLTGAGVLHMLREFELVLKIGGTANIVTPYYSSQMQAQDLDHKSQFCEETWSNIFDNDYYTDKGAWKLKVHCCFILGIKERNLALFTQLVRMY